LNLPSIFDEVKEILDQLKGKKLILDVDDTDIFKGIGLKLLAFEHLLQQHAELQGKLVSVRIVNPARSSGKDVQEGKRETYSTATRINEADGCPDYEPVILIDQLSSCSLLENFLCAMAKCCVGME
jgi:trehalose 6-phosphate synthase/phosphatase